MNSAPFVHSALAMTRRLKRRDRCPARLALGCLEVAHTESHFPEKYKLLRWGTTRGSQRPQVARTDPPQSHRILTLCARRRRAAIPPRKRRAASRQPVGPPLAVPQAWRVEAFGERAIHQREEVVSFRALALVAPQAGEAGRSAQPKRLRALALRPHAH